jgi:hypothetical protein
MPDWLVVAHYGEYDLAWMQGLTEAAPHAWREFVYHKGPPDRCAPDWHPLPNVGRESHTYLHHIIAHYDDIASSPPGTTTFFCQAGLADHSGPDVQRFVTASIASARQGGVATVHASDHLEWGSLSAIYDFRIHEWPAGVPTVPCRGGMNFGQWYETVLQHRFPRDQPLRWIAGANLAVRHDVIARRPKSFYERLIQDLMHAVNPELAHFFERAWLTVFGSEPTYITSVPPLNVDARSQLARNVCVVQPDTRGHVLHSLGDAPYPEHDIRTYGDILPVLLRRHKDFFDATCVRRFERRVRGAAGNMPELHMQRIPHHTLTCAMNNSQCAAAGIGYRYVTCAGLPDRSFVWLKLWFIVHEMRRNHAETVLLLLDTDAWIRDAGALLDWLARFEASPHTFMFAAEPTAADTKFQGEAQLVSGGFIAVKNDDTAVRFAATLYHMPAGGKLLHEWPAEQACIQKLLRTNPDFAAASLVCPMDLFNTPTGRIVRHARDKRLLLPILVHDWLEANVSKAVNHHEPHLVP